MGDGVKALHEALVLLSQRRFDEAVALAETALKEPIDDEWMEERGLTFPKPNRAKAFYVIGTARLEQGDRKAAIEMLDEALKLIPDEHVSLSNRAIAKRDLGDEVGALEDFGRALAAQPSYTHARANRARLYAKRGDLKRANEDYAILLSIADTPEHRAEWEAVREKLGN